MVNEYELHERVAVLETQGDRTEEDLKEIKEKLDELLHLKSKGMGLFWIVSAVLGLVLTSAFEAAMSFLKGPHL